MTTYGTFDIDSVPAPSDFELEAADRPKVTIPFTVQWPLWERAKILNPEFGSVIDRWSAAVTSGRLTPELVAEAERLTIQVRREGLLAEALTPETRLVVS